jgi:hypothetical protein
MAANVTATILSRIMELLRLMAVSIFDDRDKTALARLSRLGYFR